MHGGKRWRMRVEDFALARGAPEPVTVKQTAEKLWEPRFLAEIIAGRDPKVPPDVPKPAMGLTVADFLDGYFESYVEAEGLRHSVTVKSRLKAIKAVIGNLPVNALEKPADIMRFRAAYRKGREIATSWATSRRRGNRCCSSPMATTRSASNQVRASIARSFGRSTCIGTTSVTKAPVGS
jgi:hypothetical protein